MKAIALILAAFLLAILAQLTLGRGSVAHVRGLRTELAQAQAANAQAQERNARLHAELQDLREGLEMVEEKARSELGMLKPDEIYVPYAQPPLATASSPNAAPASAP